MTGLPAPQPGLVISYSYLWSDEAEQGRVEGGKNRPCAIVIVVAAPESSARRQVAVVPITRSPPRDPDVAVEIPLRVKGHLGLDAARSWVILDELNVFTWPGFDLRPIRRGERRVDYGLLPPKFFDRLIEKFTRLVEAGGVERTTRDQFRNNGARGSVVGVRDHPPCGYRTLDRADPLWRWPGRRSATAIGLQNDSSFRW
jgi:hypothetical protein